MRSSLDLESGNQIRSSSNQTTVVYGYPAEGAAIPGQPVETMRTTATASSSSSDAKPPDDNSQPRKLTNKTKCALFCALTIVFICSLFALMEVSSNVPKFEIDSMSFSILNISHGNDISSANWTVGVFARNTNRHTSWGFDYLQASLYYNSEELWGARVPPFGLGPKNQASFQILTNYSAGNSIPKDQQGHRLIDFDVVLLGKLTFYLRFLPTKGSYNACLLCGDVKVGFSESGHRGTLVAGPYQCSYLYFQKVLF